MENSLSKPINPDSHCSTPYLSIVQLVSSSFSFLLGGEPDSAKASAANSRFQFLPAYACFVHSFRRDTPFLCSSQQVKMCGWKHTWTWIRTWIHRHGELTWSALSYL